MERVLLFLLCLAAPYAALRAQDSIAHQSIGVPPSSFYTSVQTFFVNHEYATPYGNGYTLPGYHVQMGVRFHRTFSEKHRVSLALGLYHLGLMGAERYPQEGWYHDIPHWSSTSRTSPLHLRPIVALQYTPEVGFPLALTMGSFRAESDSLELPLPLRNREYDYVSDPITGVRLRMSPRNTDIDLRIHWMGFIYRGTQHQEAFLSEGSVKHYISLPHRQRLRLDGAFSATHRGGELNPQGVDTMHTFIAEALGVLYQSSYVLNSRDLKLSTGVYALLSQARYGNESIVGNGFYWINQVGYDRWYCDLSYWRGNHFTAPLASPFINAYPKWGYPLQKTHDGVFRYWSLSPSFRLFYQTSWNLSLRGTLWWHSSNHFPRAFSHSISLDMQFHPFL